MNSSEASDMRSEMLAMSRLLSQIKRESSGLDDEDKPSSSRAVTDEQRRSKSVSSWARSTTNRPSLVKKSSDTISYLNTENAVKNVRTRAPAYSIAGRYTSPLSSTNVRNRESKIVNNELLINTKDDALSTRKRTRAATFGGPSYMSENKKAEAALSRSQVQQILSPPADDGDYLIIEVDEGATGYSFGKSKRFATEQRATNSVETANKDDFEDITKAEKWVKPRAPGVKMVPPSHKREMEHVQMEEVQTTDTVEPHIDALAYRPRVTGVKMQPESKAINKAAITGNPDLPAPGPGAYDLSRTDVCNSKGAVLYRSSSRTKNQYVQRIKGEQLSAAAEIGPGYYNVEHAHDAVKRSRSTGFAGYRAESKPTPQMEKKFYFEQKAKDMREVNDHMSIASDFLLKHRVPITSLAPPKSARSHKEEKILRMRQAKESFTEANRSYNVKHDFVERRVPAPVSMKSELLSRTKTVEQVLSKPGVARAIAEKHTAIKYKDKFYGPQIPVAWTKDKKSMKWMRNPEYDPDGDGYTSPTEEVLALLAKRSGNAIYKDKSALKEKEITEAYLRSSYSGSLYKTPVINIGDTKGREEYELKERKRILEQSRDYAGPQLQSDWLSEIRARTANSLRMDLNRARDSVKIKQKGQVQVDGFIDHMIRKDIEALGPGAYEVADLHGTIGQAPMKGVPFAKVIAREEQVGPFGQRPEIAEADFDDGDLYFDDERLDIDFGEAKDLATGRHKKVGVKLYDKERYPEQKAEDDPARDHLGGTWFKGMHEEVLAKPGGLVQFEKMTGRPGKEVEEENVVMEELLGPKERIDVEIKDYNPSMAKAKTFQMADPVKQPRFEKPAKPQYDPNVSIAPNYDYIKEKQAPVADFNKMQGRRDFDKDADLEVIEAAFGGEKDDRTGVQAARERAEAIQKAKDFTSTRTPFMVDMSKGKERSYITPGQQVGEVVELPDGAESDQRPVIEPIKVKGGVTDWSKTTGRNDKELEEKLMKEQFGEEEQLDIDPEKVTTSRMKRPIEAPNFDKQKGPRFALEKEKDGPQKDLSYVDPGKFKAGGQGFGEIKAGGVTMANQVGRVDTAQEELANKMIYDGNKEELILEPSDSKLKQRAPGITTMNSKVPRIKDKHTIAAEEELNSALQEELVVDASGKAFGADARGGNPMKNKVDRVTKHEETAIKELEKDKVELILDANRDILKPKAPNVSSMKNKTERIRPRNMSLVERELSQANRHELDLRPTDVAIRQSIQGVTSMNNKARSDRTDRNEELANIDTEKEELIIEPKDLKPKILGGASMANTGDKPPKLEEEKQLRKNDRSNKIELDLDQNDDARRKRVPGGSSMSRSSSRQTISRNNSNNTTSNTIKDSKTDSRSKLKVKTDGKSLEKVKEEPTPPVLRAPGVTGKDPALKQPKNSFVNNDSSPSKMISKLDEELASLGLK